MPFAAFFLPETTYTPQGDGNAIDFDFAMCNTPETTYTPQGDGKVRVSVKDKLAQKQPTPRKGTETDQLGDVQLFAQETTYTPQGDMPSASAECRVLRAEWKSN